MVSFDRWVILGGLCVSLITALIPVIVELIENRAAKKKEKEETDVTDPAKSGIVKGKQVDITSDYVHFLKATIMEQKTEISTLEKERDAAILLLMQHGITPMGTVTTKGTHTTSAIDSLLDRVSAPPDSP